MKILKFIIALIILPLCISFSKSVYDILILSINLNVFSLYENLSFPIGFILCVLLLSIIPKPMKTYVLAHELTHALWALMMGSKIGKISITRTGGHVEVSKTNFWITLAPYFFPFYTFLVITVFYIFSFFYNINEYLYLWLGCIGFTWAFHFIFTIDMLKIKQPDITEHGKFFSYVIIYCTHLFFIGIWIVMIGSPRIIDFYNSFIIHTSYVYKFLFNIIQ